MQKITNVEDLKGFFNENSLRGIDEACFQLEV